MACILASSQFTSKDLSFIVKEYKKLMDSHPEYLYGKLDLSLKKGSDSVMFMDSQIIITVGGNIFAKVTDMEKLNEYLTR